MDNFKIYCWGFIKGRRFSTLSFFLSLFLILFQTWECCFKNISVTLQMRCFWGFFRHCFMGLPKSLVSAEEQEGVDMTMGQKRRKVLVVGVERT